MRSADSTERFSDRVEAYVAARPGYPQVLATHLIDAFGLKACAPVADLGSGTGLSCLPFLRAGLQVTGVEPNDAMRAAGDRFLAQHARFASIKGTAEATGLPHGCVDLVIAAQAAHWFDPARAGLEARRILRRPAAAALIWNDRNDSADAFAVGYEALLRQFGTDYAQIRHRDAHHDLVAAFFGHGQARELRLGNPTQLDFDTLVLRLASASYVPARGTPAHAPMIAHLRTLFDSTQQQGRVTLDYTTRVFFGLVAGA